MLIFTVFLTFGPGLEMVPNPVAGEHEPVAGGVTVSGRSDIGRPVPVISTLRATVKPPPLKP
jgi:hypothetical protein